MLQETGHNRIENICALIRRETLEPAELEKERYIAEGQQKRQELIAEGQSICEKLLQEGRAELEKERRFLASALKLAMQHALEAFKQKIEAELFQQEIVSKVDQVMTSADVAVQLIETIVNAIEKDGLGANLEVAVGHDVDAKAVSGLLTKQMLAKLGQKPVKLNSFSGGVEVAVVDANVSVRISDLELKNLLSSHLRKEFRALVFAS